MDQLHPCPVDGSAESPVSRASRRGAPPSRSPRRHPRAPRRRPTPLDTGWHLARPPRACGGAASPACSARRRAGLRFERRDRRRGIDRQLAGAGGTRRQLDRRGDRHRAQRANLATALRRGIIDRVARVPAELGPVDLVARRAGAPALPASPPRSAPAAPGHGRHRRRQRQGRGGRGAQRCCPRIAHSSAASDRRQRARRRGTAAADLSSVRAACSPRRRAPMRRRWRACGRREARRPHVEEASPAAHDRALPDQPRRARARLRAGARHRAHRSGTAATRRPQPARRDASPPAPPSCGATSSWPTPRR